MDPTEDSPQKIDRKIPIILEELAGLERNGKRVDEKLQRFGEEMFGFERDWKREELLVENGHCGMIQYRITNISNLLSDIEGSLNQILRELPRTK